MQSSARYRLQAVEPTTCFARPELKQRFQACQKSRNTICYRALCNEKEVAFVALDRWPEKYLIVLYELFVPCGIRRQGIGTAILHEVERIARQEQFSTIRLLPHPLEQNIGPGDLANWYQSRGYQVDRKVPSEMMKRIAPTASDH